MTDNNPRHNSQSSDSDDGDRESLGYAWKARYLVADADQIRFIPYSLQISGRPRHDRAVQEREAIYVKLAIPQGKEQPLCESEASEVALLRRVQPTQPEAYLPTIEKLVESLRGASHFGPTHLIPMEPVPEERRDIVCSHKKSPVRKGMNSDLCGTCKRTKLEQARTRAEAPHS
ncbi:MAG: hypothetical protein GY696_04160 [Gammaproteobacteria bacterium]|nr:hypothetical protein [Gammaproteobacteria bacterium]